MMAVCHLVVCTCNVYALVSLDYTFRGGGGEAAHLESRMAMR